MIQFYALVKLFQLKFLNFSFITRFNKSSFEIIFLIVSFFSRLFIVDLGNFLFRFFLLKSHFCRSCYSTSFRSLLTTILALTRGSISGARMKVGNYCRNFNSQSDKKLFYLLLELSSWHYFLNAENFRTRRNVYLILTIETKLHTTFTVGC